MLNFFKGLFLIVDKVNFLLLRPANDLLYQLELILIMQGAFLLPFSLCVWGGDDSYGQKHFGILFPQNAFLILKIMQCSDPNLCPCHTVMRSELVFLLTQEIVS